MQVPATERRHARFGSFTVDLISRELRNNGHNIHLQEKPFQILVILLDHPGELVTREEFRQRLWPSDTFVDFEHSINTAIKKLREALEDDAEEPRFIETLPRRGYRFIAPVEGSGEDRSTTRPVPPDLHNAVPDAPREGEGWHLFGTDAVMDPRRLDREIYSGSANAEANKGRSMWRAGSPRRRFALATAAILVLAVAGAGGWYWRAQRDAHATTTTPSIAVLPFADLSPNHDQEYFSEGLAEEILNDLAKIPNLKVAARTSAFQFKGKSGDPWVIGQKLNAANLLEGSVRRDGNRVRITVQLIKANDGFHLWSESYDRDLKDILAVEDNIAKAVTSALQFKLLTGRSPTTPTSGTTNPEAYESLLQARYFLHMQDEESGRKALDYANKAIQFDPNSASAYALRANIELGFGGMAWMDLPEAAEKARRDTEKAIALDPNLADGYRILSMIQSWFESNCREAEAPLRKALELAPRDPDNLAQSALLAMCQGRLEEAVELWKQELTLDPLRAVEYQSLAQSLRDLGRHEEAHAALAKGLDLNPNQMSMIHEIRGEVYLAQGRPQEALAEMEKEPQALYRNLGMALACHALGRGRESDAALARLISQNSNDGAYQIAQVYAYRGELDQAFEWLNRAHKQHDSGLLWLKTDLKLKSLHKDPRYAELLKKLNLPE
jgi:TolB-like protein/DNA-binding winged helix-turn-helix (wHTH) protein/Flp pilus assembly protein TadD